MARIVCPRPRSSVGPPPPIQRRSVEGRLSAGGRRRMKARAAEMGSLVAAITAVVGSVSLSLLILHPPSEGLLPWTAPAAPGHVAALILPAAHTSRPAVSTQVQRPLAAPTEVALTPGVKASRPTATHHVAPKHHKRSPPPAQPTPTPTPVPQPVTTPVTTPPVTTPAIATNNGRWSAAAKVKSWQGAAAKQATRTQKGKPSWAGPKHTAPEATIAVTTQAVAPEAAMTPPGQTKTKTPPGQAKKTK